jgi:hypothetical protein
MMPAIARRDEGCVSDLMMDRWLLGELPGSDEGRRLEGHVRRCAGCAARFQALRSLYGSTALPKAEEPLPPLAAPPVSEPAEHAAVLQVVILRDGLVVGTEVFTAGRYTVGSGATCGLRLDEVAPGHATLSLRGDRVALEAGGGPVFVNGFPATTCELRSVDEVAVGPYVLRVRVLAERWQRAELKVVRDEPSRAAPSPHALKVELFWGSTRIDVKIVEGPQDLSAFGIQTVLRIDGGFSLDGLRVSHGDSARIHVGSLVCVATAVPWQEKVRRAPLRQWPWLVTSIAAALQVCVVGLGLYGATLEVPDEDPPRSVDLPVSFAAPQQRADRFVSSLRRATPSPSLAGPPAKARPKAAIADRLADSVGISGVLSALRPAALAARKHELLLAGVGERLPPFDRRRDGAPAGIGREGLKELQGGIGRRAVLARTATERVPMPAGSDDLSPDAADEIIDQHVHELGACYQRAALEGGTVNGRFTLEWRVTSEGTVSWSRVKQSEVKNRDFAACVLAKLNSWQFPASSGSVTLNDTFQLGAASH